VKAILPHGFSLAITAAFLCCAAACSAQPTAATSGQGAFAPPVSRSLRSFGAIGDGKHDDTAAIGRALDQSDRACLDGEGRTYLVNGTLRAEKNLCLRSATLVQAAAAMDTSAYLTQRCPAVQDTSAVIDCHDPAIPPARLNRLWNILSTRTLLIRSGDGRRLRINLDHVKVDRGPDPSAGSRTDSAGIWIDGADRIDFRDVEITGNGKGYGLQITNARNVTLTNLWVHDLVWAPYRGDAPLSEAAVRAVGWNAVPIHEFREQRPGSARAAKFYGVRVQEQLTCVSLGDVSHVVIRNLRIERCLARFDSGNLPWQADGLDIGRSSSDVTIDGARIDSTWEGIDVVAGGDGISGLRMNDVTIANSFGYGLKMGPRLRDALVSRLTVDGAGLAGVVLYGPVRGVTISGASITNVGSLRTGAGLLSPWPSGNRAGLRLDGSGDSSPAGVTIDNMRVSGRPSDYEFGVLNTGSHAVELRAFSAQGFASQQVRNAGQ
jgi:hypothetical protein